jgi:hypothetical protein
LSAADAFAGLVHEDLAAGRLELITVLEDCDDDNTCASSCNKAGNNKAISMMAFRNNTWIGLVYTVILRHNTTETEEKYSEGAFTAVEPGRSLSTSENRVRFSVIVKCNSADELLYFFADR